MQLPHFASISYLYCLFLVLPPGLVSLLQSPSSYLIGVLTGPTPHFINLRSVSGIGEVVLFDLDNSGNEPFFAGIANPQQAVPDLTRRNIDDFDSASRVSLPDVLYQDLSEVLKLDKRLFWQGAVQEKLGMAAEKGKAAAKNAMKKGLKYLKGKSKSKMEGKESAGAENGDDEEAEEDVGANNDSSLSKFVGKGNYCYDHGYSNEAAEVEARVAFTTFFVSILGDLRTYLTQQTPGVPPVVDKEKYMRYRNSQGDVPGTAMFLLCGNFLRGKLFNSFVEARLKEVQLRRVVPEDAPFFALATNFHRSNRVDFYVNNVRQSVRKVASNPDLPGRHLILWNDGIRRRVMELTSTQAFNGDAMKALSQLTEDCHECSSILIDTMMVLWTRMQEGKGMQWKKALLALQVFRNLLLNGPINIIAEAIDGFASIRILRSYTEALRGQNSVLIRDAATEIYSLVVDLPVLFARRRENMNRMRLVKDPKPSPLRKETRMIKGISQFRNVHIALKPAGATVAPAPPAVNDLLTQGVPSAPAAAPHSVSYSDDLLALGDVSSSPSPQVVATGNQGTANPFDMASLSQSTPSVGVKSAVSNVPSFMANTSDASSSQSTPLHMPPPTLSASAPVPSAQSMSQHPPQLAPLNTSLVPPSQSIPQLTPQQYSQQPMPHHQNRPYPMATGAINPSMSSGLASPPHSFAPGQFPNPNNGIASPLKQSVPNMAMQQRQHHAPVPQGAHFPISHPHHPQMATQPPHNQPWGQPPPQFQHGMQGAPMVGANHYNHHPGVPNPNPNQPYNAQGGGVMQQPGQQQAPKPAFSQFDPLAR